MPLYEKGNCGNEKYKIVKWRQCSDRDSLDITASQLRVLMCLQLIIIRVERGDIRLEALADADGLNHLLKLAALVER